MTQPANPPAPPAPAPSTGEPPTSVPAPTPAPPADDKGAGGKDAILADLAKEREARKALEARLTAMGQALGVEPDAKTRKTDVEALTESVAAMQRQLAEERATRLRLEVAAAKSLPPALASRLRGDTVEELTADADALLAALPQAGSGGPSTPAPDPTQGARGGAAEIQAAIKAATDKGDTREAIRLKTQLALQQPTK